MVFTSVPDSTKYALRALLAHIGNYRAKMICRLTPIRPCLKKIVWNVSVASHGLRWRIESLRDHEFTVGTPVREESKIVDVGGLSSKIYNAHHFINITSRRQRYHWAQSQNTYLAASQYQKTALAWIYHQS